MAIQQRNLTQTTTNFEMEMFFKNKINFIESLELYYTVSEVTLIPDLFSIESNDSFKFGYSNKFYKGTLVISVHVLSESRKEWSFQVQYYDKNGNIDDEGTLAIGKGLKDFYEKHGSFYECYYEDYDSENKFFEMIHLQNFDGDVHSWQSEDVYAFTA